MPSKILQSQIVPNNTSLHKSHSINKFVANALQKSDNKECEQSEQLYSKKPIIDIKSSNHHKFFKFKLSAKVQNPEYKYKPPKQYLAFCQKSTQNQFASE